MSVLSKYKTYPEYKDSGIEWLGEIPSHWKESLLRFLFSSITNGSTETQIEGSSSTAPISRIETISSGFIDMERIGFVDQKKISPTFKLKIGDILFSHINSLAMVGNVAIYEHDENLYHGMNLLRMSPNTNIAHSKYILWLFKSKFSRNSFESIAKPAINQASISISALKQLQLVLPTLVEQTKIAQFLDHETAKIDQLIEKQQTLIELLKEKRQAVISHAVTKGLDPNVKMKDSGVEWLGEVPEHWEVIRLKHIISSLDSGCSVNAADIPANTDEVGVLKTSCVYTRKFRIEENKTVIKEDLYRVKCPIKKGAIIISRMNTPELVGASALVDIDNSFIYLPDRLWQTNFYPHVQIDSEYLAEFMTILSFREQTSLIAEGASSSMQNITKENYLSIHCLLPDIAEQKTIIHFIKVQTSKLNLLIKKAEEQIELMKERRTALISAAVTGKIDVRDWQPKQ